MFGAVLLLSSQFATMTYSDPVTQESINGFGVVNEGVGSLLLTCRPGQNEIDIVVRPDRYYGVRGTPLDRALLTGLRFENDKKQEKGILEMKDEFLIYQTGSVFNEAKGKASFINRLASNTTLHVRYLSLYDRVETISISYRIEPSALKSFLSLCNPRRVNQELRRIGSIAAPEPMPMRE